MELAGWGRYPAAEMEVVCPGRVADVVPPGDGPVIARGQGRSYGDAAISSGGVVVLTERLDRLRAADERTGLLRAEAGMTLAELLEYCLPRGWFPYVTPGTKFVSLGGCVAADVHGKNHHRDGAFGVCVADLKLALADGEQVDCSPTDNAWLFWATVGGMGLTGVITEVTVRLRPVESAYVVVRQTAARDLDSVLSLSEESAWNDQYTVIWIDCLARGRKLGRSVLMRGHHAAAVELAEGVTEPLRIRRRSAYNLRFDLPPWFLNSLTVGAFNDLYYWRQGRRISSFLTDYDSYFYPLDRIGNWNRFYGLRGFVQYQCVVPLAKADRGLQAILEELSKSRLNCFFGTLKRFGPEGPGLLSFPLSGYTLALDLPVGNPELFRFLDRLDEIVLRHEGRVYLAKDARLGPRAFREMYPRFEQWRQVKARVDPDNRFSSDLARRLKITA